MEGDEASKLIMKPIINKKQNSRTIYNMGICRRFDFLGCWLLVQDGLLEPETNPVSL